MDTDNIMVKAEEGLGVGRKESMGGKGDLCNSFNNNDFFF